MAKSKYALEEPLLSRIKAARARQTRETMQNPSDPAILPPSGCHSTSPRQTHCHQQRHHSRPRTAPEGRPPPHFHAPGAPIQVQGRQEEEGQVGSPNHTRRGEVVPRGTYDEELTAAVVYHAVDQDYRKAGIPAGKPGPTKPKTSACKPAGTQGEAPTSSRHSMYHMETLAESQTPRGQIQTLQQDIREC